VFPYDTTPVVISNRFTKVWLKTLVEAIVLVFLVMFLFLQNFRATADHRRSTVPVVLLGTFGILAAAGYSASTP
jgi:multidrug efflux pump subunit AcrB